MKYTGYMARIQITLRDDDRTILEDIHQKLGGYFGRQKARKQGEYISKPCVVWRVRKKDEVERILAILEGGMMPSKKREQMETLRAFLNTVCLAKRGKKTAEEHAEFISLLETRQSLHLRMLALHEYAA